MPWQKDLSGREPGVACSNFLFNGLHSEELTNGWVYHFGFTIESVMLEKLKFQRKVSLNFDKNCRPFDKRFQI